MEFVCLFVGILREMETCMANYLRKSNVMKSILRLSGRLITIYVI
jgi:hypothetical protein